MRAQRLMAPSVDTGRSPTTSTKNQVSASEAFKWSRWATVSPHAACGVRVRAHVDFVLEAFQHGLDLFEQHGLAAPSWAKTEHAFVFDGALKDGK